MKKVLLFIMTLMVSNSWSQYKAPDVKLQKDWSVTSEPKQEKWDSNFRVEQEPEERFIASEEDEYERSPSSNTAPAPKKIEDKMEHWPLMEEKP